MQNLFTPQQLIGRKAELQIICQILLQDGDFLLAGAPGVGRRTLIQTAAQQVKARVVEIDGLRTTSANSFLRLLADSLLDTFATPTEIALVQEWSTDHPLALEQPPTRHPRLVWQSSSGKEWSLFQALLTLPQFIAERLKCRVIVVMLNFPHIRSWDRSGKWETYLRNEIQRQNLVSYVLVTTVVDPWAKESHLPTIAIAPLQEAEVQSWIVPAIATAGLQIEEEQALKLFLSYVQGHLGDAITLAYRIWLNHRAFAQPEEKTIQAHHVHRAMLAIVKDLTVTFEALILLLPPSQVRVLESLALDPTDKPHAREYIQKHQLSRGGSLQGALTSLELKGLVYGPQQKYQIALPFLDFWLKQRLS